MPINKDAYLLWKDNEVTRAFMREMQEGLDSTINDEVVGRSIESLGMNALIRKTHMRVLEEVLKWKPEEVKNDSNN